jgi:serine acetyltransferase
MRTTDDGDLRLSRWVLQDWGVNSGNPHTQVLLALFRLTQYLQQTHPAAEALVRRPYWLISTVVMGVELPPRARVGPRLRMPHPHGIVVHGSVVMGSDCLLRQGVTIGSAASGRSEVPRLGDSIDLGAGSAILGDIDIGDGATIGALTVVTKSVAAGTTVVGATARVLE